MKTLMFYINAIHEGGAERVIIQLAYRFALAGYRSILITSFVDQNEYVVPDCIERISIENDQIVQSRFKRNLSRIIALRKLCKKYKPEAIISFMAEPNFRTIIATAGLNIKRIVSVRNDPNREYRGRLGRFVGKIILPMADGCVFQTTEAQSWFPKKLQKKSNVIFNAVDEKFFQFDYIGGNDIVTLGRLNKQKNQKMIINAFAEIAPLYPDTKLRIYGIGALESELKEQIKALNLEESVMLMGLTTDSVSVLQNSRIFVLSSDYEGMPNALVEALTVGVPSISTDCPCGGPKSIIENNINGILIPVGGEKELSLALVSLLSNKERADSIGKEAKKRAQAYHPDIVFARWREYVESIIDSQKRR